MAFKEKRVKVWKNPKGLDSKKFKIAVFSPAVTFGERYQVNYGATKDQFNKQEIAFRTKKQAMEFAKEIQLNSKKQPKIRFVTD